MAPDGFIVHETVSEYIQIISLRASELGSLGIKRPKGMPKELEIKLYGGGTLIFNEYCRLKYHVRNKLTNIERQNNRAFNARQGDLRLRPGGS